MTELTFREVQELVEILGDNEARKILSGKIKTPVSELLAGSLKPIGEHVVGPLAKTFVSKSFFRDDNPDVKLYIWGGFKNRILPSTGKVSKQPAATIVSFDLTKPMYDREIRAELPENHVFAIEDLWIIADIISRQPKGESGTLLNNGYANLFYVQAGASVFVVYV
ncbi:MAG: hypothetical protein NT098_05770, partial [Candidatus Parcubacteria bacterium]|nr:hypothetical protein [Candidatus Parcubacteria bacterium]